jgi:hypothetical protein
MQTGKRHLAGAMLFVSLLAVGTSCLGQDGTGGGDYVCLDPYASICHGKACSAYRPYTEASQPDLFYNFYVPNNMGAAAAAYPAPYPTPSLVGHTYYTYQPLMPHEFLYTHHRTYHQYYNGGMGLNRTRVHWYRTPVRTAAKDLGGSVGWFLGNLHH